MQAENFRLLLQDTLVKRCQENASYSLRAFARDLGMDGSVLSKVLNGKRPIGKKLMARLGNELSLSPDQMNSYVTNSKDKQDTNYEQLAMDSFAIISDWYHYAILELILTKDFKNDKKWMAKCLGLKVAEVSAALERLERVGLIELQDGQYVDVSGGMSTNISNNMSHGALRKLQKQLLEKAIKAVDSVPYEKRSNTSMTMAVDTDKLPEAVSEIKKFRRKMDKLLSSSPNKDAVYNLSVALYPLSKLETQRGNKK